MREVLRYWLTFEEGVRRGEYLRHGAFLMALKYGVDAALVGIGAGSVWRHHDDPQAPRRRSLRLVDLGNGRTRLEGSTWYEQRLRPEGYWALFSDAIIGRIHERVLEHIAASVGSQR